MASRWRAAQGDEMNLTPLLDVIFCLLFFFILATSLKQQRQALEVQVPRSGQDAQQVNETRSLEVAITRGNEIRFENRAVTVDELEQALRRAADASGDRKPPEDVLIRTDAQSQMQTFIAVSDACARAGLKSALLETEPLPNAESAP